eukprot:m.131441 g.131441  ORF g.131441 m.131441 type:complete len:126 (-) comp14627_c0_seq5:2241-2618(-)
MFVNMCTFTISEGTEDRYMVEDKFTSKYTRLKIPQVSLKEASVSAKQATRASVEIDRRYEIEACIVRVMKSRKRLDHSSLLLEVVQQVSNRFSPAPQLLKRCVEHLLDRDYLSRDEEQRCGLVLL